MPHIKAPSGSSWYYSLRGEGNTSLLFIHGWAADANIWYGQMSYFSKLYKVIALDLPGHGKSSWHDLDFSALVDDIVFIIKELKLDSLVVLGLSFGGQIAMELSLKSRLINKLILIDTTPKFVKTEDFREGLSNAEINKLSTQLDIDYPNILAVFGRSLFTENERQKDIFSGIWELFSKKRSFPNKQALKKMLDIIAVSDLRSKLAKIKIPTLIVCGEYDPICPVYASKFLNENIANSKLEIIEKTGHMPFLTEEERFNNIVDGFLR